MTLVEVESYSLWWQGRSLLQVIARLGSLQTVNATPVTSYERKDSELRYMRSVLGMQSLCAHFLR